MAEADLHSLLTRQHSRIDALEKQLNIRPAEAEDVDLPAAEYAKNFYITIAVCVYVCAFQGICAFTLGGREGNASQIMHLFWPICYTMLFAMLFGALDSEAAGRRALQLIRALQACYVISGQKKHNDDIAILVVYTMTFFWYVCKLFVGRLLVVARRAPVAPASVKPVDTLGALDLP